MTSPDGRGGRTSDAGNATEKVMRLLEATAAPGGPHRLGAIAAAACVPKASSHRILQLLVAGSFLTSDGQGRYAPGPRLRALSAEVCAAGDAGIDAELAALQRHTGNTVHLALRSGDYAIYTHKVQSSQPVQMASRVGMRMPLHSTAIGKCILSGFGEAELTDFAARAALPARTGRTLTDLGRLRAELEAVRRQGFAVDDEENEATIRCLGAPLRGQDGTVIGGVSISTVTFVVPRDELLGWAGALCQTAAAISAGLRSGLFRHDYRVLAVGGDTALAGRGTRQAVTQVTSRPWS
ncbi:MAG TPA: IclR family transcriptional regulator [Streptosporangiaceae bacterium]|nr:IclR family transcriptional regulator [Streptosporangiaceae bacterium]